MDQEVRTVLILSEDHEEAFNAWLPDKLSQTLDRAEIALDIEGRDARWKGLPRVLNELVRAGYLKRYYGSRYALTDAGRAYARELTRKASLPVLRVAPGTHDEALLSTVAALRQA